MPLDMLKDFHIPGTPPGTLTPAGGEKGPVRIFLTRYAPARLETREIPDVESLGGLVEGEGFCWVQVIGLGDVSAIGRIGEIFGLHPLALEDVVHLGQRPKVEDYENVVFATCQILEVEDGSVGKLQLAMFLGPGFVVTFQEAGEDRLAPIRSRLEVPQGRLRNRGPGYLAYAILDRVVDSAFPALEALGERLEDLDDRILENPDRDAMERLQDVRRDLLRLRQVLWPQREVLARLSRDEHGLLGDDTRIYLRDCHDHAVQALEVSENYREMASGLLDIYLSSVSNRLGDVMRVLTIISTVFIPLGFLAGVYGMNFRAEGGWNMPELGWKYGYLAFWAFCAAAASGMLLYFRRKGWL